MVLVGSFFSFPSSLDRYNGFAFASSDPTLLGLLAWDCLAPLVVERTAVDVFLSSSRRLLAWPCEFARRLDMADKSLGNRHPSCSVARSNTSLASSELLPLRRWGHVGPCTSSKIRYHR